jgi:hypothetical protein
MLRSFLMAALSATATLALASAAHATIFTFETALSGADEVPPTGSPATGFSSVLFDDVLNDLTVEETWSGLTGGNASAAHIHCCVAPGHNIGVAVPFVGFPAVPTGSYFHVFNLTSTATYTSSFLNNFGGGTATGAEAALLTGLEAGQAYANIHNPTFPGGEIRGFLVAAPEPAAWALMLGGFGLAGAAIRGRRAVRPAAS